VSIVLFVVFFGLVAGGERGGDTFFSNPALATTILAAGGSAVVAGCVGALALGHRDRSIVVIVSVISGIVVALWTTAEIVFPH
jgi:hypothetical protein